MTDKTMTLDPCPFCGGRAKEKTPYVRCVDCGAQMNPPDNQLTTAVAAWNARHLSQPAERGEAVGRYTDEDKETIHCLRDWVCRTKTGKRLWGQALDQLLQHASCAHPDDVAFMPGRKAPGAAPPPAAGVPDALPEVQVCQTYMGEPVSPEQVAYHEGWNECRAAMLSATPSPTIDVAVCGACFGTGEVTGQNGNKYKCYYGCAIGYAK